MMKVTNNIGVIVSINGTAQKLRKQIKHTFSFALLKNIDGIVGVDRGQSGLARDVT